MLNTLVLLPYLTLEIGKTIGLCLVNVQRVYFGEAVWICMTGLQGIMCAIPQRQSAVSLIDGKDLIFV